MSFARSVGFIGLGCLGLWLSTTSPARAGESSLVDSMLAAAVPERVATPAGTGNIQADCTYRGIRLAGKVKVVESFPDIRVKAVSSFPDLKVKTVTSFPNECGKWQFVESFPDFKIQYVESFPDIEIAWVDSFPGLP
jgi:hypothetical protein